MDTDIQPVHNLEGIDQGIFSFLKKIFGPFLGLRFFYLRIKGKYDMYLSPYMEMVLQ